MKCLWSFRRLIACKGSLALEYGVTMLVIFLSGLAWGGSGQAWGVYSLPGYPPKPWVIHSSAWPKIRPVERHYTFKDGPHAGLELPIYGTDGRKLYRLRCHTYLYTDPNFDYSGDFECILSALYHAKRGEPLSTPVHYYNLLVERQEPYGDWDSRGRFLIPDILGACTRYPQYGLTRSFKLRGMKITLRMRDPTIVKKPGKPSVEWTLASFRFTVQVVPDPRARRSIAQRTRYLPPLTLHPNGPNSYALNCAVVRLRKPAGAAKH